MPESITDSNNDVLIKIYQGQKINELTSVVCDMRVQMFKEFPYLYAANQTEEANYIKAYAMDEKAVFAVAYVDNQVVGVATGIPLLNKLSIADECATALTKIGENPADYYYYGDVLVSDAHQGRGIASQLFAAQDVLVKQWGYKKVSILTVMRPDNHPLKPDGYQSYDAIWQHFGYSRAIPAITSTVKWSTYQADGSVQNQDNELEFWIKPL